MQPARPYSRRLMGAKDAARYLGISESTLRQLGLRRRLLGSRKLYDIADLEAFADSLPTERANGDLPCREESAHRDRREPESW